MALLDLQRGDFVLAQTNGTQALVYSQLSKDWNVYVAAQIRMASIFSALKRIGSALNAYNDALYCINTNTDRIHLRFIAGSAGLAEIQATMGREAEALQLLKLAMAVFPPKPGRMPVLRTRSVIVHYFISIRDYISTLGTTSAGLGGVFAG